MNLSRVLIVEDEGDIRDLIVLHLKRVGFVTCEAVDGESANAFLESEKFDLVVLDWMLPGLSGIEILNRIRKGKLNSEVPVLMVTARSTTSDIVLGLESGADDYVTKPFEPVVLVARVRALLRRREPVPEPKEKLQSVQVGLLKIDPVSHQIFLRDNEIHLTASEFKLVWALVSNRGRVLTRNQLIELVQGEGVAVVDRAIDTHVFGLRKKLGDAGDFIETVRGVGYRIGSGSQTTS